MNFDFSDEQHQLRDQARRFLSEHSTSKRIRQVLDGVAPYDRAMWQEIAAMGWLGAAVPEEYGGAGLGHVGLCVLAEELGRSLAPVPFSSSVYLATEALLLAGSESQKEELLPKLVAGELIGTLAWAEGAGNPNPARVKARVSGGKLSGAKWPVADGGIADIAIVAARDDADQMVLALVRLGGAGVHPESLTTVDPTREQAKLSFDGVPAEVLPGDGWAVLQQVLERAAVMVAFEQVGLAQACLDMAVTFAMERHAFGRPIGSFQAIKHKLADVYVATELARSNAYYGAWALSAGAAEMPLAAASARVSATEAAWLAAKENIQTHGGVGFTWEIDCHLYYRRAKLLGLTLGAVPWWKDRVVSALETRNAA
ncbi:MAG: acyl-CoA/acyl-ACP dehydrogenase [Acetobacteraceae bacterium]|nr:acyl-CoA/acyl-ACP dehydrogenase [Acetobacteraceae bacterium]